MTDNPDTPEQPKAPDTAKPAPDTAKPAPAAKPALAAKPAPVVHKTTVIKRSRRRGWLLGGGLAAAIAALLYARCAGGLGFGRGEGKADQSDRKPVVQARAADAAPAPTLPACELRLGTDGLTLDGAVVEIPAAIERCKPAGKARLTVTGDANYGALVALREALEAEGIVVLGP